MFHKMSEIELATYIAVHFPIYLCSGGSVDTARRCNQLLRILAQKSGGTLEQAAERCRGMLG